MNKFGFKTYVSVSLPRPTTPKRPFDKRKDLKKGMEGLWAYGTSTGKVASRRTDRIVPIAFDQYVGESLAHVVVSYRRYATVSIDRIFTAEERPIDAA